MISRHHSLCQILTFLPNFIGKLIPCLLGARVYYRDFFRYMNKYLAGELVIMNNGDISVGEGFDLIDPEDLTDKMYLSNFILNSVNS